MADKKIVQLTALATQATTDLYETSANGAGSFKETRAQQLTYTKANIATAPYVAGDLIYANSTSTLGKIPDAATGNALISGGVGVVPSYGKVGLTTHVSGTLPVANGGTNQTSYTDGQLLIGNSSGNTLSKSTLTAGTGISITNGGGSITIDSSDTLQTAYDNGTPGSQGSINLTSDNLNPFRTVTTGTTGPQHHTEMFNNTNASVNWGPEFTGLNSALDKIEYVWTPAYIFDDTAGSESATYKFQIMSHGVPTIAFLADGFDQDFLFNWPVQAPNGTRTYQTTKLLTGDITYGISYAGAVILSNDLADHIITLNNYFSTNGDDSFVVQTQSTNVVTVTLSGGVTVNGSASDFIVPVNTRATFQLVNAGTKSYMVTMESLPQPAVAFSSYLSTTQNSVTGAGTTYNIVCDAQPQTSLDYNATTGEFTARYTGYHQFSGTANVKNLDAAMTSCFLALSTTSFLYPLSDINPWATQDGGGSFTAAGAITVYMNAGDTAKLQITIQAGSGDNVNLTGGNSPIWTSFSGSYISTSSGAGSNGEVEVIDDNSTNATMYPLFVADISGAQPTYVSSASFQWNPGAQTLTIGNDGFGDNIAISGDIIRWKNGVNNPNWDMGELSGPGFGPPNWSIYDYNNSTFLLIADTEGYLGPNPTTLYFMYPYNSFANSTTANQLMATDSNNLVTSVTNTLGKVNITDNNSTNAWMNLVWVTSNSGDLPTYTSSDELQWNPGTGNLTISNPGPFGPVLHLNSTAAPGSADSWIYFESSSALKGAFGYRDSLNAFSIYVNGNDRMFVNSSGVVTIPELTAASGVATDGSSNLISIPLPISGTYTPTLTAVSNVGTLSLVKAFYSVTTNSSGQTGTAVVQFTCIPSNTSFVVGVDTPVAVGFNASDECALMGGNVTHTPGVDDGYIDVNSQSGFDQGRVIMTIPAGGIGQTYTVNVSFMFQIQ